MKTLALVTTLFVCIAFAAPVARAGTVTEHQVWASTTMLTRPLTSWRLLGWLDLHDRRRQDSTLLILRPGVGYQLLDQLSVYAGYAWVPTFEDEGANRHEHRSWQQLLFNARASQAWAFALRPRFEQRFAEGGNETGYRVRLLARTTYTTPAGVLLVVWDEFFYQANDTDWGAVAGFDQNRAFAGIGLLAINDVRIELGYLNVFTKRKPDSNLAHNLAVNLFWTY